MLSDTPKHTHKNEMPISIELENAGIFNFSPPPGPSHPCPFCCGYLPDAMTINLKTLSVMLC
jgi:hypothetical protein